MTQAGWKYDDYGGEHAERGQHTDVFVGDEGVELTIDIGSGYDSATAKLFIPREVLVTMLRRGKWTEVKP